MFYKSNLHGVFVKVKPNNLVTPITAGATGPVGHDARAGPFCIRVSLVVENLDEVLETIVSAGGGAWA